ncbi:MAG: hypothetical protein AAFV33_20585 [Chloroflexota bacterium]
MVSPNREELMKMAVRSAKQGNKDGARVMFRQVLEQDAKNERAIMWLAKLSNSPTERKTWLERALAVNPDNDTASEALAKMEHNREERENRTLITYGTYVVGAVLLFATVFTALWAFAPLR